MNATKDKVTPLFFHYAIPSVLGMVAISSAGIIDGFFVGNYVGSSGLAAVNISYPVFALLFGLSSMFGAGGSVVSGKLIGEGDTKQASIVFSKTIIVVSIFSVAICMILFAYTKTILQLFGATDELVVFAVEYLSIMLIFMPFLMLGMVLSYFVRVDGRPKLAFYALLASAATNIALDWLLIAYLGFGLLGAALATGISQLALIVMLLPHFFSKKATLKFVKSTKNFIKIIKAADNGASEFVNEASIGITVMIFNSVMIKTFGVEGVAAFAIISYIVWIGMMINFGISDSLQPLISKNFGAKKPKRVKEFLKLAFLCVFITGVVVIALITLAPAQLISLFLGDSSPKTMHIALGFAALIWPIFLFNGINLSISAYFTATHQPMPSAIIAILRSLVFPVLFIFTLPLIFGINGIFLALPAAEICTFVIAVVLLRKMSPNRLPS